MVISNNNKLLLHDPVVIVLSPLLSLINDQVNSANNSCLGITATSLDPKKCNDICTGKFNIVFGTPESWLQNKRWRDMLSNSFFTSNLVAIVEIQRNLSGKSLVNFLLFGLFVVKVFLSWLSLRQLIVI